MSSPYHPPYHQSYAQPEPTNGLGVAGFIVSLVGLVVTCGLLCPLGLLLSLFALFKRPRGFAFAGTVIGLVGTAFIIGVFGLFATAVATRARHTVVEEKTADTESVLAEAEDIIDRYFIDNGQLPEDIEGNKLLVELVDGWGGSIRYDRLDEQRYLVRSPGEDGEFDTDDDVVSGPDYHEWGSDENEF
jgi:hypothetical protein